MNTHDIHFLNRIILIAVIGVLIFLAVSLAIYFIYPQSPVPQFGHMMMGGPGRSTVAPAIPSYITFGAAVAAGLVGMLIISMLLFRKDIGEHEFKAMKRALSEDETKLVEEVRKEPDGITQDSLRFRFGWSKAKVSTILGNLDRQGIIQRERLGKHTKFIILLQEKNK